MGEGFAFVPVALISRRWMTAQVFYWMIATVY
jgi:hypothetical protein